MSNQETEPERCGEMVPLAPGIGDPDTGFLKRCCLPSGHDGAHRYAGQIVITAGPTRDHPSGQFPTWVSVDTALPTKEALYIVAYRTRFRRGSINAPEEVEDRVTVVSWAGEWNALGGVGRVGFAYPITHWMPLPPAPETP